MTNGVGGGWLQCIGDGDAKAEERVRFNGAARDAVLQRRAIQKLHGNERLSVLCTDVINRADVGVVQGRRGLRLALEPGEGMRVSGYVHRQKLERDETVETGILSFVHDSHSAATELLNDAEMRDGLADHGVSDTSECHVRGAEGASQRIGPTNGRHRQVDALARLRIKFPACCWKSASPGRSPSGKRYNSRATSMAWRSPQNRCPASPTTIFI